jgi:hypothetical protein
MDQQLTLTEEIEINDDIESLIAAKTEYKNSETLTKIDPNFLINPFRESTDNTLINTTSISEEKENIKDK